MSEVFQPHGYCLNWDWSLIAPYILANLSIAIAYYLIPICLLILVRKAKFHPLFDWFGLGFAIFILSCGTGHLIKIAVIWIPMYWSEMYWDIITGLASVYVAAALIIKSRQIIRFMKTRGTEIHEFFAKLNVND